jgi:hypothetical protein
MDKDVDNASLMPSLSTILSTVIFFAHKCKQVKTNSLSDFCSAKIWLRNRMGYRTNSLTMNIVDWLSGCKYEFIPYLQNNRTPHVLIIVTF